MRSKAAGYVSLVGVSQFLLVMVVSEALYPGYSVRENYISDLGVGPTSALFNASIIAMGLAVIAASALLRARYSPLLFLTGAGAVMVGLFPETTGLPHLLGALIAFLFGGVTAVVTSKGRNPFWAVLGVTSLVSLVLYATGNYGPLGPGGMERMIVCPELIWGVSFSSHLAAGQN